MFDPSCRYLDGFRTIAFDPPGIGETDLPARPYSVQRLAGFAAGVLAAVGVGRADVLGVSLGGAVAQELAHVPPRAGRPARPGVHRARHHRRARPAGRPR